MLFFGNAETKNSNEREIASLLAQFCDSSLPRTTPPRADIIRDAFLLTERAREICASGVSHLSQLDELTTLLDRHSNSYYRLCEDLQGVSLQNRRWGNLRIAMPVETGPAFSVDQLTQFFELESLRTASIVAGKALLRLRDPHVRADGPFLQQYGFAVVLEALSHQISGLEILPDEFRSDPRTAPPALRYGKAFQDAMLPLLRALWNRAQPPFSELTVTCAFIDTNETISRFLYNNEGCVMVLSRGFLLQAEGPSRAGPELVLYRLSFYLAAYQLALEQGYASGFWAERKRIIRAFKMMENAGCDASLVYEELADGLGRPDDEQELVPFWGYADYESFLPEPNWRTSLAAEMLEPVIELVRKHP